MSEILKSKIKERLDHYTSDRNIIFKKMRMDYPNAQTYDTAIFYLNRFIIDLEWLIAHLNHEEGKQKKTEKPTPITYGWENIIANYEGQGYLLKKPKSRKLPPGFLIFKNCKSEKYFWVYYMDLEFKAGSKEYDRWWDCFFSAWQYFRNLKKGEKHD